jgi:hypothetical protein
MYHQSVKFENSKTVHLSNTITIYYVSGIVRYGEVLKCNKPTQHGKSCTISVAVLAYILWIVLRSHHTLSYGLDESQNLKSVANLMTPSGSLLIVEA